MYEYSVDQILTRYCIVVHTCTYMYIQYVLYSVVRGAKKITIITTLLLCILWIIAYDNVHIINHSHNSSYLA